jgi:hypothetical protein
MIALSVMINPTIIVLVVFLRRTLGYPLSFFSSGSVSFLANYGPLGCWLPTVEYLVIYWCLSKVCNSILSILLSLMIYNIVYEY